MNLLCFLRSMLSTAAIIAIFATAHPAQAQKKAIVPKGANPAGPYSPGILSGNTLYVAGQIGRNSAGQIPDGFEDEVKACLDNVGRILEEAGVTFASAVSVQVYLTDMELFDRMNKIYMTYFPEPRPARTTVGVSKLVGKSRIEITVTADASQAKAASKAPSKK